MKLLSFGEVLWDVYPDDKYIGGAPLNFAAHFVKNGGDAYMLSSVGKDDLGKETIKAISKWGVHCDYITELSTKETGKCLVTLDEHRIPSYNLLSDVAYDAIEKPNLKEENFDVLYFGTLALRSKYNLETLKTMISENDFKEIFVDMNIRPPHYSKASIELALNHATLIKISDEELPIVLKEIGWDENEDLLDVSKKLSIAYPQLKVIIITKGDKGSFVYDVRTLKDYSCEAKKVVVASTVGAGDSFSAAFLSQFLQQKTIPVCLDLATKVSAFVVSKTEAIPEYTIEDLD